MIDKLLSPFGRTLKDKLVDYHEWEIYEYKVVHKPTFTTLWTANGTPIFNPFFNGYGPTPPCLTLFDKLILWPKLVRMLNTSAAQKLKGSK